MTPLEALEKAIAVAKSQTALASGIGGDVRTGHIYHWLKSGRTPAEYCPAIERFTRSLGNTVTCEELCPRVEWAEIRMQSAPAVEQGA